MRPEVKKAKLSIKAKPAKKVRREKCKIDSNNIKELLEKQGMPQQELADLIGSNASHISRIISGKRCHVSLPIALKIAFALKTPVEKVFICKI